MMTTTETEVRTAPFNELLALTTRLLTQAESLAALVARLKLDAAGERGDPEVAAQLDRVVHLIGAGEACANLDERERTTVIGHATTMLRQSMELIDDPIRPGGWYYTDPQILQGQGAGSVIVAQLLAGAGIGGPDARILDVGTGVGALAVAFCRTLPELDGGGSGPLGAVVRTGGPERCRRRVRFPYHAESDPHRGLRGRRRFRPRLDAPDLPCPTDPPGCGAPGEGSNAPGAEIVLGRYTGSDDPLAGALGDLRTIRSGGTLLGPADTRALLSDAGLVDVREIERTWPAPLGLTVGRCPTNP